MGVTPSRLEKLVEILRSNGAQPLCDTVQYYEEAIRLGVLAGKPDLTSWLISGYRTLLRDPVPYEIRFYCDFNDASRLWRTGELDQAEEVFRDCMQMASDNCDDFGRARSSMALGVIQWSRGNASEALPLLEAAEAGLREEGSSTLSNCLNWLGVVCNDLRLFHRAWEYYQSAYRLNEELDLKPNQGYLLCNLGLLCQLMGLDDIADDSFRKSLDIQREVGDRYGYADSLANLGMLILKRTHGAARALPLLREAAGLQKDNGERAKAGLVLANTAIAEFRTGDTESALRSLDEAESLVFSTDVWVSQIEYSSSRAEVLIELERFEEAEAVLQRAIDIQKKHLPDRDDDELSALQAELYRRTGRFKEASKALRDNLRERKFMEEAKDSALQSVVQMLTESARKNRELSEAREHSAALEEQNRVLSRSEERFRSLVDGMAGVCVLAVDESGMITYWNSTCERQYGYSADEMKGRGFIDVLVPAHLRTWIHSLLSGKVSGEEFEVNLLSASGGLRHALVSIVPLSSGETFVILVDLTSQRRAENQKSLIEAQMRRTQKLEALGTLAGGIAHDFNNLLQGILGNASILCEAIEDEETLKSAELIRLAAERSSELCSQMLDYAGVKPIGYEALSFNELVRDMVMLLETSLPKKVTLDLDLSNEAPLIMGDRSQLRQIVMNLALNGAEAIESTGTLSIATTSVQLKEGELKDNLLEGSPLSGTYLLLRVRDDGSGIEPETLTRIFDPFFSTKKTGRGLGLAAVLGIIKAHEGAITVDSVPGQGTEFRVFLRAALNVRSAATRTVQRREVNLAGKSIMVVDDERIVRETVSTILSGLGAVPVPVSGGAEALSLLDSAPFPDLILLDLTMPGMDGTDVFRVMQERGLDIPVLIISGYSRERLSSVFTGSKPGGFLQKPFSPEALKDGIMTVLSSS